jgi:hypothetical protein
LADLTYSFNDDLEDQLLDQVSGERLMDSTREIAQYVRLSGSPEELEAFRWVESEVQRYGYDTSLTFHEGYISLPGPARLLVETSGGAEDVECITHAFAAPTPPGGVTAEVVYVPSDVVPPEEEVAGKIVLTGGMAFGGRVKRLESLGAVAQIYIHDDYLHETPSSPIWGSPTDGTVELLPTTPGIAIRRPDAEVLQERLNAGPVMVTIHAEVDTGWREIPVLTAEHPELRQHEHFVLFSSHVDSWYYGAMDNASANATLLEVARLLAEHTGQLRRGLRLAFWSGHSHGRFCGSAWYADNHWHELYEDCVCHVNVDSTGGVGATVVTEPPVMPETRALAADVVAKVTDEQFEGKRIGRFADQSFYGVGLPSIFGTLSEQDIANTAGGISFSTGGRRAGGLGWWWHTPHDTVDKVDEGNLVRDTKIYLGTVFRLCSADRLPFDYREAVRDLADTVEELQDQVGRNFDFSALRTGLKELQRRVDALYDEHAPDSAETFNASLNRLARHLVPISFHERSRYERDLAGPLQPIPSLREAVRLKELDPASAEARFLRTRLQRQYNRVLHSVTEATIG